MHVFKNDNKWSLPVVACITHWMYVCLANYGFVFSSPFGKWSHTNLSINKVCLRITELHVEWNLQFLLSWLFQITHFEKENGVDMWIISTQFIVSIEFFFFHLYLWSKWTFFFCFSTNGVIITDLHLVCKISSSIFTHFSGNAAYKVRDRFLMISCISMLIKYFTWIIIS